jgi:predicted nucleotide-binding protein
VVLEIGLVLGRLGQERVLLLRPRGVALKLPSDLDGLGTIDFVAGEPPDLAVAAERVRRVVVKLGVR